MSHWKKDDDCDYDYYDDDDDDDNDEVFSRPIPLKSIISRGTVLQSGQEFWAVSLETESNHRNDTPLDLLMVRALKKYSWLGLILLNQQKHEMKIFNHYP